MEDPFLKFAIFESLLERDPTNPIINITISYMITMKSQYIFTTISWTINNSDDNI